MKSNRLKSILLLIFLSISYLGNAQLRDPFGKVVVHEIKLKKLKDGTRIGAMEWTTGGIDSLQRFVINGLDVKTPVLVRITTKAPDHNIDLSFYKSKWDKVESKIATEGNKFVEKTFRTMNNAGLGVSSKVEGIPYLITVKTGLQFPTTSSVFRVTNNKEEYAQHMRKLGFSAPLFDEGDASGSSDGGAINTNSNNNTLTYVVIGLLSIIILLLVVFLLKKKGANKASLIILLLCSAQFSIAQSRVPKEVPVDGQGNSPVFYEYQTSNIPNQNTVPVTTQMESQDVYIGENPGDVFLTRRVRVESNTSSIELSPEEAAEIQRRIEESDSEFDANYGEDSPGENTQGDQRILPTEGTSEEQSQLRRDVEESQDNVSLLADEDEAYDEEAGEDLDILFYCEDSETCQECIRHGILLFDAHRAYFDFMQKFYLKEVTDLNDQIAFGNSLASIPGAGLGWGPILLNVVRPAMDKLKKTYNDKFDDYIAAMEEDLEKIRACSNTENGTFRTREAYDIQMNNVIDVLKAKRIQK